MSDAQEQNQPSASTETSATPQPAATTAAVDPWAAMPRRKGRLMTSRTAAAMAAMSGFTGAMGPATSAATDAAKGAGPAGGSTESTTASGTTTSSSNEGRAAQQGMRFDMHAALHDACKAGSIDAFNYVMKLPGIDVCTVHTRCFHKQTE